MCCDRMRNLHQRTKVAIAEEVLEYLSEHMDCMHASFDVI